MPRWVDTREVDEEEVDDESTSEEEDEEEIEEDRAVEEDVDVEEEDGEGNVDQNDRAASNAQAGPSGQRGKISISLGKKGLVCHVRFPCPRVSSSTEANCVSAFPKLLTFPLSSEDTYLS